MIEQFSFVQLVSSNPRQTAFYLANSFGFKVVGYRGLETGERDYAGYLLAAGEARIIVIGPLTNRGSELTSVLHQQGESINVIGLVGEDGQGSDSLLMTDRHRGVLPFFPEARILNLDERLYVAVVTRGQQEKILASFQPATESWMHNARQHPSFSKYVGFDHIVVNCRYGRASRIHRILGAFGLRIEQTFDSETIKTSQSTLTSAVLSNRTRTVRIPVNEPPSGESSSQIQEFLDYNGGCGVQHLAFRTRDVRSLVLQLKGEGTEFLSIGQESDLEAREVKDIVFEDSDDHGLLRQCFSELVQNRPTLFFEFIERQGAVGFGAGNFQKLFEAVEKQQQRRGNLNGTTQTSYPSS